MTRVIAIVNQKGGVGKTTTVVNLGAGAARKGKRVLLVDLDHQGALTSHLGVDPDSLERTIYDALKGEVTAEELILRYEEAGLDFIGANMELSGAEMELVSAIGRERLLKDTLEPLLGRYDLVLLDCSPSLGLLTVNALTAANEVLIPVHTEYLALRGMGKLLETLELVRRRINPDLKTTGILSCMYDGRRNLDRDVIAEIRNTCGGDMLQTVIRRNVAIAEAPIKGVDIFKYEPASTGAEDYGKLVEEVIGHG